MANLVKTKYFSNNEYFYLKALIEYDLQGRGEVYTNDELQWRHELKKKISDMRPTP